MSVRYDQDTKAKAIKLVREHAGGLPVGVRGDHRGGRAAGDERGDAAQVDPVPLEESIERLTCAIACGQDAVIVGRPGATQDRRLLVCRILGLAVLMLRGQEAKEAELLVLRHENAVLRRHAGRIRYEPADRAWFAALAPLLPRRRDRNLPRDAPDAAGLAPQAGSEKVRHEREAQAWPPADGRGHRPPCHSPREGEPAVGTPPDPRQTGETRRDGRAVHRLGDPACRGNRSVAAPLGSDRAQFLHAQATGILAVVFLHADTMLLRWLYVLVFIEHGTRRMHVGAVTANPTGEWAVQQARNLTLTLDRRFEDIRFLLRGRGPNFAASFDAVFLATGTRILVSAVQAPRMNATCERLIGTLRREVLDRMLIVSERHLRAVLTEYQVHYNTARPH